MKSISIDEAERFIGKRRGNFPFNNDIEIARIVHERSAFSAFSMFGFMLVFISSTSRNPPDWIVVFPVLGFAFVFYFISQMRTAARVRVLFEATAVKSIEELRSYPETTFDPPVRIHSDNL